MIPLLTLGKARPIPSEKQYRAEVILPDRPLKTAFHQGYGERSEKGDWSTSDRSPFHFFILDWLDVGGLVNPQLRASSEHIPIVRAARAQGIDQAALSGGGARTDNCLSAGRYRLDSGLRRHYQCGRPPARIYGRAPTRQGRLLARGCRGASSRWRSRPAPCAGRW